MNHIFLFFFTFYTSKNSNHSFHKNMTAFNIYDNQKCFLIIRWSY